MEPNSETDGLQTSIFPQSSNKATQFPLFALPPEIRNKIYAWTFILSRSRDEVYDIPDFVVHGEKAPHNAYRGGLRWANVPSFPLLLVSRRIFQECLPIISLEAYMEVKIYTDESMTRRSKRSNAVFATLLRTRALCQNVHKVKMDITPNESEVYYDVDEQIPRLAKELQGYGKLREVKVKAYVEALMDQWGGMFDHWGLFVGFFEMAKRGLSLTFELFEFFDHDILSDEEEDQVEEMERARQTVEKRIWALAGKGNVWIEWNHITEEDIY